MPKATPQTTEAEPIPQAQDSALMLCNPGALISQAIAANIDIDKIERLFALREQMRKEAAERAFNEAFSGFQGECPVIAKTDSAGSGGFTYKYTPLDTIKPIIAPILKAHGLSYSLDFEFLDDAVIGKCTLCHVGGHNRTSTVRVPIDRGSRMNDSQKIGAACSYVTRYALIAATGTVCGGEDTDANHNGKEAPQSRQAPANGAGAAPAGQGAATGQETAPSAAHKGDGWHAGRVIAVTVAKTGGTGGGWWRKLDVVIDGQGPSYSCMIGEKAVSLQTDLESARDGMDTIEYLLESKESKGKTYTNLVDMRWPVGSGANDPKNYMQPPPEGGGEYIGKDGLRGSTLAKDPEGSLPF